MNVDTIQKLIKDNSPTIISVAAVAGVITTAVLTARAAIKAQNKLDARCIELNGILEEVADPREMTKREKIETVWMLYIPAAISGASTIGCIVWANRLGLQRNAALIAAAALADRAFHEYRDEVVRTFGEKGHDKVNDAVAERRLAENPPPSNLVIVGDAEQRCYDMWSGRYFRGNVEAIKQAVNILNHDIIQGNMYADVNEFYALLGLGDIDSGSAMGWNVDNMCEVGFSSHLGPDSIASLAMFFQNPPKADFGKTF